MTVARSGRWIRTLACSLAVLASTTVTPLAAAGLGLAESFEEIALKNEHGPEGWMPVRKWQQPIALYIDSRVGDRALQTRLVRRQIETLTTITGHPITLVRDPDQANLYLLFEREANIPRTLHALAPELRLSPDFLNRSLCFGSLKLGASQQIEQALVVIPPDRARYRGRFYSCIVEELTQAMGLVNDSERVYPSIFNDRSIDQELSALDIALLRLLYDPEIRAGMTRAQVMPRIRRLIATGKYY